MRIHRFVAAVLVAALTLASGSALAAEKPAGRININTASAAQLEELPGVGAALAARIVEHRQKNGQFRSVEEVMNVKGIGEKNFARLQPFLTVGSTPAQASKETPKR